MRRASVDTSRPDLRHLAERIAAELDSGRGADVSGGLRRDPGHRSGQRARRAAADPGDPGDDLQHPAPAKGEHVTAVAGPASVEEVRGPDPLTARRTPLAGWIAGRIGAGVV